ncbi:(Fe-S)-binding protein [Thermoactinomyces mirandus]|uniref:Glycolate oxidase iron-sulfur subunit n=1 Tax=Thermoactinomyces mirandus TaxID=2756294 RepID=A0A7W1XT30_9BACL|nr:(Fe-S)-binding protein [Thermoactinomyces mirandus]MBA4602758.1 (Fe-S)-binding protein [Thermoactinomyces mirandus]
MPKSTCPPLNQVSERNLSLAEALQNTLDEDQLTQCMRCGFCLPACPTYRETGFEDASPRGRIALMKAVYDGEINPGKDFINQINLCLGCRGCEPACPAGVSYGRLLEQSRSAIYQHKPANRIGKSFQQILLRQFFLHQNRLKKAGSLLGFYQRSVLKILVDCTRLNHILPKQIRDLESILPVVEPVSDLQTVPPAKPVGRVGLFRGCIMDVLFARTNQHTIQLLNAAGYEVIIPDDQTCCGALHAHTGDRNQSVRLAKQNIEAFAGIDVVCSNAGGCGAMLVEYAELLKDEPEWHQKALSFEKKIRDISELLYDQIERLSFRTPVHQRVTYQDSCHLINGMKVTTPRRLLKKVENTTFVELTEANRCCGSAGIYNILQPEMANRLLKEKMGHVKNTRADVLITSNPGCLLQMKLGVNRAGLAGSMEVMHLVDFLAENIQNKQSGMIGTGQ